MLRRPSIAIIKRFCLLAYLGTTLSFGFCQSAAFALGLFEEGVKLYKAGQYRKAIIFFDKQIAEDPNNTNAIYYAADCYLRSGDTAKAVILYNAIIEKFPKSVAARYSRKALLSVSRAVSNGTRITESVGIGSSSNSSYGNDSQVIPFTREESGHLVVTCMLDGRPQRMIFDTGASVCVATENQLRALDIEIPANSPVSRATGVSGTVSTRLVPVVLRLGDIKKRVTMSVMQELPTLPLLGETFFGEFQYIIDNSSGNIRFFRPGSNDTFIPVDTIDVPFVRRGNELEIRAKINGVEIPLYFDTGAQSTVVPANVMARTEPNQWQFKGYGTSEGVGGSGTCRAYEVKSMEVGSIRNYNAQIIVVDRMPVGRGLLGQDFFGHRKFTIDNQKNVIRFWR